jgi:hypothetical protein
MQMNVQFRLDQAGGAEQLPQAMSRVRAVQRGEYVALRPSRGELQKCACSPLGTRWLISMA